MPPAAVFWQKEAARAGRNPPFSVLFSVAERLEGQSDFVKNDRIVDCGGHFEVLPVRDFDHGGGQDLARARFGEAVDHGGQFESGTAAGLTAAGLTAARLTTRRQHGGRLDDDTAAGLMAAQRPV